MAFNTTIDRAITISVRLGDVVNAQVATMNMVRKREQSLKEAAFQQTVIDQSLPYEAQLEYRKKQLADVKATPGAIDAEYVSTIEGSIKDIRKLIRFKKIREDYLSSYDALKSGKINLGQHLQFLEDQYRNIPDEDARNEIRNEITSVRAQINESETNTLNNRVILAQKDGTVAMLQSAIDAVSTKKAMADLTGNLEESSAWDISLVSLKKQLNETKIVNSLHDLDFKISNYGGTSIQKLDMLNSEIAKSDGNTPITVQGVTYNSAKDFWTGTRNSYINGTGDGQFANILNDLEGEVKNKIDTVSAVNKFGFVPVTTLESIQNDYNGLAARPEFATVVDKLTPSKVAALSYGVDKSANALINSSVEALQLQSGQESLKSLQAKFGIDTTAKQFELQGLIISKGSQLKSIKDATTQLQKVGAETPSTELPTGTTPGELFKSNNQPSTTPGITVKPEAAPAPAPAPAPVEAGNFKEYVIKAGDTLSGIAKTMLGDSKKYTELAKLNNIADPNKISAGAKLKIPVI